jgi:hypothetical protein
MNYPLDSSAEYVEKLVFFTLQLSVFMQLCQLLYFPMDCNHSNKDNAEIYIRTADFVV